ncbi:MAG: 50S ribosomal protein L11 methyltransferase [Nitrospirota bacterium]
MGYYEFKITVADESRDALLQGISAIGCLGVVEHDGSLTAYFSDTIGIDAIRKGLDAFRGVLASSGLNSDIAYEYVFISERDWNESWKKKFKPIDVGEHFSILPPWEEKVAGRINLIIDPGMAFGTGHHETTKTCLLYIERFSHRVSKERFLDVGTGTGVLAIAASFLGFASVLGVDIDPLAIDAAQRNARHNNLKNVEIREGSITTAGGTYDFIAANLMSEILISIAPELASRLTPSGVALLSGMIVGQEDEVIAVMENAGLRYRETFIDGRWVTVIMSR